MLMVRTGFVPRAATTSKAAPASRTIPMSSRLSIPPPAVRKMSITLTREYTAISREDEK
jgi:hypothetical protein